MARIRSVHPSLWTDEEFVQLSMEMRLFLLRLGSLTDYADRFEWNEDRIAAQADCPEAGSFLAHLSDAGLIRRHGHVGEILFAFGFPRKRISKWELLRSTVLSRDGFKCQYCGAAEVDLHCDHVVPVSRGGSNNPGNLVAACRHCNLSKGSKLVEEWLR